MGQDNHHLNLRKGKNIVNNLVLNAKRPFDWKLFLLVWGGAMLAWLLVLPFTITMLGDAIREMGSLSSFIISTFISNLVTLGLAALIGSFAAKKIGLGLPFIEGWLAKSPIWQHLKNVVIMALAAGVLLGVLIIAVDVLIFTPYLEAATGYSNANLLNPDLNRASPWQGFLAAISAGVTEEILFRFFGISLVAWLGGVIFKDAEGRPKAFIVGFSILLWAVIFGLAHLQMPAIVGWELSTATIVRSLVINSLGGLVYGWMYWKKGLESAIVTHFSTDLVLHVIVPLIILIGS
jgi:hypothetical protein